MEEQTLELVKARRSGGSCM